MKKRFFYIFFCLLAFDGIAQVYINEACSANKNVIEDEFGESSDWIELYNNGNSSIDLSNFHLSDDPENLQKWSFPSTILAAKKHLLIFASDKNIYQDYHHTNFKLSKSGETISLSDSDGNLLDQMIVPSLDDDESFGRIIETDPVLTYFQIPSPGTLNAEGTILPVVETPQVSEEKDFHETPFQLSLNCDTPEAMIFYTKDGTPPTAENGILYTTPIEINQSTTIRARSFLEGFRSSEMLTKTYFYQVEHDFPILSLVTDPDHLYDWEEGIFVLGPDAQSWFPFWGANFWKDIEIPVDMTFYKDHQLKVQFNIGAKVHGGKTARTKPMKSIRLFVDKKYGSDKMDYPFFEDRDNTSFSRLVLRNASGDYNIAHVRDALLHRYFLKENLDIDMLAFQPVVVYINGAYFGLMNLREKVDRFYLKDNHDVDIDNIDLLEEDTAVQEGNFEIYHDMLDFVLENDMTDNNNFDQVRSNFDLEEIADYYIVQTAVNNTDWPANNIKYWRERKAGAKWRYILFDMDLGLGAASWSRASSNSIFNGISSHGEKPFYQFMQAIWQNEDYRHYFLNRYADLLNTIFREEIFKKELEFTEASMDHEVRLHFEKWLPGGYDKWKEEHFPELYEFVADRPPFARQFVMQQFELEKEVQLQLNVFPEGAGQIKINTITPDQLPWDGFYFKDVPVELSIIPNPGFTFRHWQSSHGIPSPNKNTSFKINFNRDDEIFAFFEAADYRPNVQVLPNPVQENVQVQFLMDRFDEVMVTFYDSAGQMIQQSAHQVAGGQQSLDFNVAGWSPGVYLIDLKSENFTTTIKMIR